MLNPYLFYNGNCEASFKFYEKVLGGKIEMLLRNEEASPSTPSPRSSSACRSQARCIISWRHRSSPGLKRLPSR